MIVPRWSNRLGKVEDVILSLYAQGMTTGDISAHMEEICGTKVSATTIPNVTDGIPADVAQSQNRLLEAIYPIVHIDAVWLKIRGGGTVKNKVCHLAVGVDMEGRKQVLGMWIADQEGAKF